MRMTMPSRKKMKRSSEMLRSALSRMAEKAKALRSCMAFESKIPSRAWLTKIPSPNVTRMGAISP